MVHRTDLDTAISTWDWDMGQVVALDTLGLKVRDKHLYAQCTSTSLDRICSTGEYILLMFLSILDLAKLKSNSKFQGHSVNVNCFVSILINRNNQVGLKKGN